MKKKESLKDEKLRKSEMTGTEQLFKEAMKKASINYEMGEIEYEAGHKIYKFAEYRDFTLFPKNGSILEVRLFYAADRDIINNKLANVKNGIELRECFDKYYEKLKIKYRIKKLEDIDFQKAKKKILNELHKSFIPIPAATYSVCKYQVTQKLFQLVMGVNPSEELGWDYPVNTVNWYDTIIFCNKLSKLDGKEAVYSINGETDFEKWNINDDNQEEISINVNENASGYRLLTKKERIAAAKGGESFDFPGGNNADFIMWYMGNSSETDKAKMSFVHDIGLKQPNGYGLYDMSGNIEEWVWDTVSYDKYSRYAMGGCFSSMDFDCKTDSEEIRALTAPRHVFYGFRIACKTGKDILQKMNKDYGKQLSLF
ncbi:MAG: formylglycine-generating enzyme family protein [Treponema sp.]|nr:formylglycine-generating enzyme family protein [Treponema sp.]